MSLYQNFKKADSKCRRKFLVNMVWKGFIGFLKFRLRTKKGLFFPAFQFISVTDDCNLSCQGCWVSSGDKAKYMSAATVNSIIEAGKRQGSFFYGILGGEPLMHKQLIEIVSTHPECYFLLFTNGTLLNNEFASKLRLSGNVSLLISLEGDEKVADIRRGGHNIYKRTLDAISTATTNGLITGVAISVCKSNIDMALSDDFIRKLHDLGILYIWYYIYRPTGTIPTYELALDSSDILRLRKFLVNGRSKYPVVLIDSYWHANGEPFCPAAEGLSHHINPYGYIEPCPVVQLSLDNIADGNVESIYENSVLLKAFRDEIRRKTRGCVLMEDPAWLKGFAERYDAINTSNREHYLSDLENAPIIASHGEVPIIPERKIIYRLAKRFAFFGLGAYG